MSDVSAEAYLIASKELLLAVAQGNPRWAADAHANVQEAIEHIDRTRQSIQPEHE